MANFAQTKRLLTLTSPLGTDKLLVEAFHGTEAISELFDFYVEVLATPTTVVTPAALIGKRCTLQLETDDAGAKRSFNGIVAHLQTFGGDSDFNVYRIQLKPTLWLLSLNTNTRVFQGMTVVDIVKKVLTPYSITPADHTKATYTALDYTTQYRETDLAFIRRLMEQHGIFFYFTHTATDHTLVLADDSAALPACTGNSSFPYVPTAGDRGGSYEGIIHDFASQTSLVTGQYALWDYRFSQFAVSSATPSASKVPLGANAHEFYDFADSASAYLKSDSADGHTATLQTHFQNIDRDLADSKAITSRGGSNVSVLEPGFTFTLKEYPQVEANVKYLLTSVVHNGRQRPSYRAEAEASTEDPYRNTFEAQPASIPFRAQKVTPRPRVSGVVTGKVVAPSGDESYLDKYGRVCVQFWWDRTRKPNTTDNTLLRVAQQWAGKDWGTYFWPRLGDEVLIDFIDGDPDAPIVVGSLYNGTNLPRYDPAKEYTRSGILSHSSRDGGKANANELRFDDLKGSEQIFINAEKDFDTHVENDAHTQIDKDEHLTLKGSHYDAIESEFHSKITKDVIEEIGGDQHLTVKGKQLSAITGDQGIKVDGDHALAATGNIHQNATQNFNQKSAMNISVKAGMNHATKAGLNYTVDAGMELYLKAGMTLVIESGLTICLKGAGGFIMIGPSGVIIQGITVLINSGGAAVPGTPGQLEDPKAPAAPKSPTAPKWPGDDPRA